MNCAQSSTTYIDAAQLVLIDGNPHQNIRDGFGGRPMVVTSTNFNTRGMHEQTDKILTDYVLVAVEK